MNIEDEPVPGTGKTADSRTIHNTEQEAPNDEYRRRDIRPARQQTGKKKATGQFY